MKPIMIGILLAIVWSHGAVWGHNFVSQKAEFIQKRDVNYCKEVVSKFNNKLTGKITIRR